jgi:hypothetical protein
MSDIRIDFDRLDRAHSRLRSVIGDFESASQVQAHLAGATGHPRLIGVVDDFRSAWSVRRGQLAEELHFIDDAVQAISETFKALDESLADQAEYYPANPVQK